MSCFWTCESEQGDRGWITLNWLDIFCRWRSFSNPYMYIKLYLPTEKKHVWNLCWNFFILSSAIKPKTSQIKTSLGKTNPHERQMKRNSNIRPIYEFLLLNEIVKICMCGIKWTRYKWIRFYDYRKSHDSNSQNFDLFAMLQLCCDVMCMRTYIWSKHIIRLRKLLSITK